LQEVTTMTPRFQQQTATDWLRGFLAEGPRALREIQDAAFEAGWLWPEILRAARSVNVRVFEPRRQDYAEPPRGAAVWDPLWGVIDAMEEKWRARLRAQLRARRRAA
jgi:hypothetical protein